MLQSFEAAASAPAHYVAPAASNTKVAPTAAGSMMESTSRRKGDSSEHYIFIVTGPAGCGKSTVAKFVADRYGFEYIEGDDFHPKANIDKMAANIPLNDADRWDWLIILRDEALKHLEKGAKGVVVTCSALKKKYRDVIRTARLYDDDPNMEAHFVYLRADLETLLARVGARKDHYMKDAMVKSQMEALEEPDQDEIAKLRDVEIIDVKHSQQEVQNLVAAAVDGILAKKHGHGHS